MPLYIARIDRLNTSYTLCYMYTTNTLSSRISGKQIDLCRVFIGIACRPIYMYMCVCVCVWECILYTTDDMWKSIRRGFPEETLYKRHELWIVRNETLCYNCTFRPSSLNFTQKTAATAEEIYANHNKLIWLGLGYTLYYIIYTFTGRQRWWWWLYN